MEDGKKKTHPPIPPEVELLGKSVLDSAFKVHSALGAVVTLNPVFKAQLLTYLRITGLRLGFLINFNVLRLKEGIHRIVH